jgi:hypothetical protein
MWKLKGKKTRQRGQKLETRKSRHDSAKTQYEKFGKHKIPVTSK